MQLDEAAEKEVKTTLMTCRIIVGALTAGVVTFAGVVLVLDAPDLNAKFDMLTMMSIAFAVGAIGMSFVVPRVIVANQCEAIAKGSWPGTTRPGVIAPKTDAGRLAAVFQTKTIIGCALLEGAAFFALLAHFIEHHIATLAIAGVLVLGLLLHMPSQSKLEDWIDEHQREIDMNRGTS